MQMSEMHTAPLRKLGFPPDIPPLGEVGHEMDVKPRKWKEVQEVVGCLKASSAPRPNAVSYRVYKSAPDILTFLWRQ